MSDTPVNADAVLAQLSKAMKAHRTAHHASVLAARRHRETLRAQREGRQYQEANVAAPDEAAMASGMPADLSDMTFPGLGDEGG